MKCYQCKIKEALPELTCFCSVECKDKYNEINPAKKILNEHGKVKRTISDVQKRIAEIIEEKRLKREGWFKSSKVI